MTIFLIATFLIVAALFYFKNSSYKKTSYYQITKNSYWSMDKGSRGEYLTYNHLKHLEGEQGKFLFNIFLPRKNGETTEIDLLLITRCGIFVFESKNFSGWIFGNEFHEKWTQTLPAGKGRSHKEQFYNPIRQNASHIKQLRRFVGDDVPLISVIVFSSGCTLKKIVVKSSGVHVLRAHDLSSRVGQIIFQNQKEVVSDRQIRMLYDRLYPFTQVTTSQKEQHRKQVSQIRLAL